MTTCPWCGETEPSEWLLRLNHWVRGTDETGYDWCEDHGMCIAMQLTRNHVISYARLGRGEERRACLVRAIERAEQLWAKAGAEWIEPYRNLCLPVITPEPVGVAASEDVALW